MITATELLAKGEYLEERGDYLRARRMYEKALSIQERNVGDSSVELVPYLYNLGLIETALENKREAHRLLKWLLKILVTEHGNDHEDVTEIRDHLRDVTARRLYEPAPLAV